MIRDGHLAELNSEQMIQDTVECSIRGLTVTYELEQGRFAAVRKLDLDIVSGHVTALIGESGSGKTTLGLAMLNGVVEPGKITQGSISYKGKRDIVAATGEALRVLRGRHVGMVFQAAQNSLNPLKRIGAIIMDLGRSHGMDPRELLRAAMDLSRRMALDPERVLAAYQHELSGGMKQRINIILALILNPEVLILDEPTTALDVISQAHVLNIIKDIQRERQLTTVLITHDIGVVAELADRVCVMYAGRIVEQGLTVDVLSEPRHPYTQALIHAIPRLTGDKQTSRPLSGSPPDLTSIPTDGCVFYGRCPIRMDACRTGSPRRHVTPNGHAYQCNVEDNIYD